MHESYRGVLQSVVSTSYKIPKTSQTKILEFEAFIRIAFSPEPATLSNECFDSPRQSRNMFAFGAHRLVQHHLRQDDTRLCWFAKLRSRRVHTINGGEIKHRSSYQRTECHSTHPKTFQKIGRSRRTRTSRHETKHTDDDSG